MFSYIAKLINISMCLTKELYKVGKYLHTGNLFVLILLLVVCTSSRLEELIAYSFYVLYIVVISFIITNSRESNMVLF